MNKNIIRILFALTTFNSLTIEENTNQNFYTKSKEHFKKHWPQYVGISASILAFTRFKRLRWITNQKFHQEMLKVQKEINATRNKVNDTYNEVLNTKKNILDLEEKTIYQIKTTERNVDKKISSSENNLSELILQTKRDIASARESLNKDLIKLELISKDQQKIILNESGATQVKIDELELRLNQTLKKIIKQQQELIQHQEKLQA